MRHNVLNVPDHQIVWIFKRGIKVKKMVRLKIHHRFFLANGEFMIKLLVATLSIKLGL